VVSTALQLFDIDNRQRAVIKKNQRILFILALVNPLKEKGIIE